MNLSHFTTDIFKPEISWDSSRRKIVEQMDDDEQLTIAKHSTGRLRYSAPEIRRSFELSDSIRERYAKLFLTNELILAELKTEKEIEQYQRMFRLLNAQIKNHDRIISTYRRDSGYRISALVNLTENKSELAVEDLYADLDALADMQKVLDSASQLEVIIRIICKRGAGIDSYDVKKRAKELTNTLNLQIDRLLVCLEERVTLIEDGPVSKYLVEQFAKQSHGLDDIHESRLRFGTVKATFETVNECLSSKLAATVSPLIDSHEELRLAS